jgi:hypothetical protein
VVDHHVQNDSYGERLTVLLETVCGID